MYAFDVHCNAFFPMFLLLYVLQLVLSPLLLMHTFVSTLLSAGVWRWVAAGALGGRALLTSRQGGQGGPSWLFGSCRTQQHSLPPLIAFT